MWIFLVGVILYHELMCKQGELLSESVDRGLRKHPVLIHTIVLTTAAHLLNWLPSKFDPFVRVGTKYERKVNW